jgi:hypothetical protein
MNIPTYSARDLAQAVERELGYRRRVFPRRVADGKMKQVDADRQIAMFEHIRDRFMAEADAEEAKGRLL